MGVCMRQRSLSWLAAKTNVNRLFRFLSRSFYAALPRIVRREAGESLPASALMSAHAACVPSGDFLARAKSENPKNRRAEKRGKGKRCATFATLSFRARASRRAAAIRPRQHA
jgi:hypothetical protein